MRDRTSEPSHRPRAVTQGLKLPGGAPTNALSPPIIGRKSFGCRSVPRNLLRLSVTIDETQTRKGRVAGTLTVTRYGNPEDTKWRHAKIGDLAECPLSAEYVSAKFYVMLRKFKDCRPAKKETVGSN